MQPSIKASIIGVTGYTGLELLRLLLAHPHIEIGHLTSRQHKDTDIGDVYPHLGHLDLKITNTDHNAVSEDSDVVFLCLPHKTAQDVVADLHGKVKVIDLSADYRLDDVETYKKYYTDHNHPNLLKEVVYGLPEIFGTNKIATASTVANPGCFALLGQMLLYPFKGLIESANIFAVTGSSGAGKSPGDGTHHPIRSHNMQSYNINAHRHIPEITRAAEIAECQLNFVPTSGSFVRGIFAQGFVTLKADIEPLDLIEQAYAEHIFVRVQKKVSLANIVGSNFVDLSAQKGEANTILVQGAIDNLVKGAAGSAVQNMNLMFDLDEGEGLLELGPLYP
ncbi:MAG: N-acetyl-gamma-glutamyl-phosphate reductase [Pseudomonadota bacterium]